MEEKKKFDKIKYNIEYRRTHKKRFGCDLNIDEYFVVDSFLKKHNINKTQFVRDSFKKLKEELEKE